tara:strand:- start:112 stop:675 length:564 start_codon:yes stop_codon:yes gene_type:complete
MHKKTLSEKFIITGTVDTVSFVKPKLIENHCLSNFSLADKIKDDQFWHLEDYSKTPYHQHIHWFQDYIRDHYKLDYNATLVHPKEHQHLNIRSIIQQSGESINYHNHVNPWDLENSPEVSCLYCVSETPEPVYVIFKYNDGRNKHLLWKEEIKYNKYILFNSDIDHYITQNKNSGFLVNLSTHYQLI